MTLYTVSTGGTANANDVDQYHDLLTGAMTDQPVTIGNRVQAKLTGATNASGYVGGFTGFAPASGTFLQGDFGVSASGPLSVCTTPGSPGTWRTTPIQINGVVEGGATASVTFGSIPSTFSHLQLTWHARGDTSGNNTLLLLRFNGDTSAIYQRQFIEAIANGGGGSGSTANQTSIIAGQVSAASATANFWAGGTITITGWASPGGYLNTVATGTAFVTNSTNSYCGLYCGQYNSTGPYTSLTLLPGAGNFVTGSAFSLYGYP